MNPFNNKLSHALTLAIYALAIFLLVGAVLGLKAIGVVGEGVTPAETISVNGTGYAYAIPNIATIDFDVTAEAADVTTAQTQVTNQVNTALAYLKAQGIASADIQTTNYTIEPHYEYQSQVTSCPIVPTINIIGAAGSTTVYCPPAGKQVLTGYDVTDSTEVTVRDTTKVGTILAGLGSEKVSNLSGPNFSVSDPDSVDAQARAAAITDAKNNAQTLAGQLGVRLGGIVNFSESSGGVIYPMMLSASANGASAASAPTPEVAPGQNKVTSNVTITYEIN